MRESWHRWTSGTTHSLFNRYGASTASLGVMFSHGQTASLSTTTRNQSLFLVINGLSRDDPLINICWCHLIISFENKDKITTTYKMYAVFFFYTLIVIGNFWKMGNVIHTKNGGWHSTLFCLHTYYMGILMFNVIRKMPIFFISDLTDCYCVQYCIIEVSLID